MFTAITRSGGFVTLTAFVLSACSAFRPESYACDEKVTAIEISSRVEFFTTDTSQPLMIRLNGVSDEISKAAHMRESSGVENKLSNQIIVNKVGQIIKREDQ